MKIAILFFAIALVSGCATREQEQQNTDTQAEQGGTATGSVSGEIMTADDGYIIENAGLAKDGDEATVSIKETIRLKSAMSDVVIIRSTSPDGKATEMLALEIRKFAEGTEVQFTATDGNAAFWIFGMVDKKEVMARTGSIEGSIRLAKMKPAENGMGLNRDVIDGTGDMEVVVSGIDASGLLVPSQKKYAARYQLPMITLDEFARITPPNCPAKRGCPPWTRQPPRGHGGLFRSVATRSSALIFVYSQGQARACPCFVSPGNCHEPTRRGTAAGNFGDHCQLQRAGSARKLPAVAVHGTRRHPA